MLSVITLNRERIDVDIRGELEQFEWSKPRWTSDKLIAASPFRDDRTPSFFCSLAGEYAGVWSDSGASDTEYESGNLPKLLAFFRNETYEEACEYLIDAYGIREEAPDKFTISPIKLAQKSRKIALPEEYLGKYQYRNAYLSNRGITEKVQRFMGVGYSRGQRAITMPWRHADGSLATVKFRRIHDKIFWYASGGAPVKSLVYGIDKVYKHDLREIYICESETDAMSVYVLGAPAVAIGGASVSEAQLNLIRKSPAEHVVLAVDNDPAGRKVKQRLIEGLSGYVELSELVLPKDAKDVNDTLGYKKLVWEVRSVVMTDLEPFERN